MANITTAAVSTTAEVMAEAAVMVDEAVTTVASTAEVSMANKVMAATTSTCGLGPLLTKLQPLPSTSPYLLLCCQWGERAANVRIFGSKKSKTKMKTHYSLHASLPPPSTSDNIPNADITKHELPFLGPRGG